MNPSQIGGRKIGEIPLSFQHLQIDREKEKALQAGAIAHLKRAYLRDKRFLSRQHQELLEQQFANAECVIRSSKVEEGRAYLFCVKTNLEWFRAYAGL